MKSPHGVTICAQVAVLIHNYFPSGLLYVTEVVSPVKL